MREAWLIAAEEHLPRELLQRIPGNGIHVELLEEALRGTPLEGIYLDAMWMHSCTDNFFLDYTIHDDGFSGFSDPWDDDVIEDAKEQWQNAKAIVDKTRVLEQWLEEDLEGRFTQMLDFVLERLESVPEDIRARYETG